MDSLDGALTAVGGAIADLETLDYFHAQIHELSNEIGKLYTALSAQVAAVGSALDSPDLAQRVAAMIQTLQSFDLQYLQLQSQMQNENRSYTAVSNIMKTKHDTVKNSISNVR
jgi:hypothetical protein